MKTIGLAFLFLVAFSSTAFAQGRIAVFDIDAAVLNTDVAKRRLDAFKQRSDVRENSAQLEAIKREYQTLVEQFQKEVEVLSAEQRQAARNRIETKRLDGEHVARKLEMAQAQEVQSIAAEVGPKLQKLLPEVIKDENIGLLVTSGAVLHADSAYNITALVAERLNRK